MTIPAATWHDRTDDRTGIDPPATPRTQGTAMTDSTDQPPTGADRAPQPPDELAHDSIGFVDALVIGLNATSPAYSLAAVIGPIVALVGVAAPGVLLASFVPMLLIASAFYYLNRADQDCGTTFSWVTRAMGPWWGWQGGWAITMTGVLVIGALADVAVRFGLLMVGLDDLADNKAVIMIGAVALVFVMTALCVMGTELSAHIQNVLIVLQVLALLVFATVALVGVFSGDASADAITPSLGWLNPFTAGGAALTGGLLLGVFAYWGWESAVNLTEETENSASAPGRAGILSTILLLVTYLSVAYAIVAYMGTEFLTEYAEEEEFIFGLIATEVLGGWDWIVLFAVMTSAIASTQTTIIPASRTALSMARRQAIPHRFAHIHHRFHTPDVSTWWVAVIASVWYVVVNLISENALFDSLTALSLLIAFYYALTGLACAVYHRRHLTESIGNFVLIGAGPVVGGALLLWLLVESVVDMADPANSYSGQAWFGLGPPLVIGLLIFVVGIVLMLVWRTRDTAFWEERAGVVDPEVVRPAS
jgi:amino acid transporter